MTDYTASAADWDKDKLLLGVVPNAAGNAYPELVDQVLALYASKVAALSWVPSDWYDGIKSIAALPALPVIVTPYKTTGELQVGVLPSWVTDTKEHADAWAAIAKQVQAVVSAYIAGKITEGRALMDQLNADAAFWAKLDNIAEAIADAPANAVNAALGGAQRVFGGIFGALFKSWLFWLALIGAALYFAWSFGLLKFKKRGA